MAATDKVWGITRVKDEQDVLAFTLRHMASEGVDGIFVMDNGSTDRTQEIIEAFRIEHGGGQALKVVIGEDPDVAYYQSDKMTDMADRVHQLYGANWIIPFDADEVWWAKGQPLAQYLRTLQVDCVRGRLFNHFPTSKDLAVENPFERITWRDANPAPLPKVAVRWQSGMRIGMGNHTAEGVSYELVNTEMVIDHFPWRSPAQFVSKVRNGATAINATDLSPDICAHWRNYGSILDGSGPEAVEEIYETWFNDPGDVRLVQAPAPYRRWA